MREFAAERLTERGDCTAVEARHGAHYATLGAEEALRAVYVDWKGGGQINFLKQLGAEWWSRWQRVMAGGFDPRNLERYRGLGIDYLVVEKKNRLVSPQPAFENAGFVVYSVRALTP